MKDIHTGELSGPPLKHDEWLEEQDRLQQQAIKQAEKDRKKGGPAAATVPTAGTATDSGDVGESADLSDVTGDDRVFAGRKLSFYRGKTDEQIRASDGVGEATFEKIKDALAGK